MTDWTAGYVADIGYTYGYYTELHPLRVQMAFLNAGLAFPKIGTACELGFGQGLSTNIHAAASVTQWSGTDFNPSQAGFAQELAQASGVDAKLYDDAFADFCNRPDLPDFDYISLHGIWSWISDENRKIIVEFIRRKLKVGGVLYISYNTLPGWAPFAPMRHLMTQHAEIIGSEGHGIVNRIEGALSFAEKLLATNPVYLRANPFVEKRLEKMKEQDRQYLAHEYFNRDWHPMHFGTMVEWLTPAKLSYACSAHYLDHINVINLTTEQATFLSEIEDPMFRESVRDFMVNQQFRRDYWVKGARKLNPLQQFAALREQRVMLIAEPSGIARKVSGQVGEAELSDAIYDPILTALADYQPRTLGEIERRVGESNINFSVMQQAIMVLTGLGHVVPVQNDSVISVARPHTDRLNAYLMQKARGSTDVNFLASPVTGSGISIDRFGQIFLLASKEGLKTPEAWAQSLWSLLASQGQRLIKDGKPIESLEANLAELTTQAKEFALKKMPILKALQIA